MNSDKAKQIFDEYHLLKNGGIKEYNNTFPYFDFNLEKTIYFTSRATALKKDSEGNAAVLFGIIEPEITSNELRLLALLKMNLSSKEIASSFSNKTSIPGTPSLIAL